MYNVRNSLTSRHKITSVKPINFPLPWIKMLFCGPLPRISCA